jgi:hypothetical protein
MNEKNELPHIRFSDKLIFLLVPVSGLLAFSFTMYCSWCESGQNTFIFGNSYYIGVHAFGEMQNIGEIKNKTRLFDFRQGQPGLRHKYTKNCSHPVFCE